MAQELPMGHTHFNVSTDISALPSELLAGHGQAYNCIIDLGRKGVYIGPDCLVEEASWRKQHGGAIMEEASYWRRDG